MPFPRLSMLILATAVSLSAEEPGNIYLPGAELLDADGKALLDQGNAYLKQSYHAIQDHQDPVEAERLLRKVISIAAKLGAEVGATAPGGSKVGIYGKANKNRNIVETSGGLDGFAEMEMRNLTTITDFDFKVHHRIILANFISKAKDLTTLQKFIINELVNPGKVKSYVGSATASKENPKKDPNQPKTKPDDTDDNDQTPRRMAAANAAHPPPPSDQPQHAGGNFKNALEDKTPQQQSPDAIKTAEKNPDGTPANKAQEPKAAPHDDKSLTDKSPTIAQKSQSSHGAAAPNAAAPNANAPSAEDAAPTSESLAQKQDQVAKSLDEMAAKSKLDGADHTVTDAFRKAANAARDAAAAIRSGDRLAATNAAKAAQNALNLALATAQGQGEQERQEQTAELERAVTNIQERQSGVVTDAKKLADALAAGTVSRDEGHQQQSQLSQRQADIKQQIDALQQGIQSLATTSEQSGKDGALQPVKEGLTAAATALHDGRAPQEAVNATINFEQGHQDAALAAIARENAALEQAHAHLADAADAAAGGHASDRKALNQLQRLSTALRQLSKTTQAAVAGANQEPTPGEKPEQTGSQEKPSHPGAPPKGQLPEEVGNVLDATADNLSKQLDDALKNLPQISDADRGKLSQLTKQRVPMGKDPGAGIEHLSAVVSAIESMEADLSRRIEEDHSHAALETFLKDPVPAAYRSSVADYYQLLANDLNNQGPLAPDAEKAAP